MRSNSRGNEQQQETIGKLEAKVAQLEEQVGQLDEQLKASKKLKGQPKILPSQAESTGTADRQVREASRFRQTEQEAELGGG